MWGQIKCGEGESIKQADCKVLQCAESMAGGKVGVVGSAVACFQGDQR